MTIKSSLTVTPKRPKGAPLTANDTTSSPRRRAATEVDLTHVGNDRELTEQFSALLTPGGSRIARAEPKHAGQ